MKEQTALTQGNVPISVETVNNNGNGIINIGINYLYETPKTILPPLPKLMFQVKDQVHTFTGRKEFLQDLHNRIQKCRNQKGSAKSALSQTFSISGLGGIGKSETARRYIQKFESYYDNIIWIDAEHPSEAQSQFTSLFNDLHLITHYNETPREFSHILADFYAKLCQKPKLLLIIFDNAEALDTDIGIRKFLPLQTSTIEPPIILVTSRQPHWDKVNVIALNLWTMEESIKFIYKQLGLEDTPENKKDAFELAKLFDRLPIALEVATSVIAHQSRLAGNICGSYGIQNLIKEYTSGDRNILKETSTNGDSTQGRMQVLLSVSLEKIKGIQHGELALSILAFMAYLSPTSIPKKMLHALVSETHEERAFVSALALLTNYSIIQSFQQQFSIHRVFQDVVITTLPELKLKVFTNQIEILTELTIRLTEYLNELKKRQIQEDYNEIVTNVLLVTNYIVKNSMIPKVYTYIEIIAYLITKTHYESAIKLYRALIDCDRNRKNSPTKTFEFLEIIGKILFSNGRYGEALETYYELVKEKEKLITVQTDENNNETKGSVPVDILRIKMNIALCLSKHGKHQDALQYYETVRENREQILGSLHPDTLFTKVNLADCLGKLGKEKEALKMYAALLEDQNKVLGPRHPDTLLTRMNTANCLSSLGRKVKALKFYFAVRDIQEEKFGPLNYYTLMTKSNLAVCVGDLENYKRAALLLFLALYKDQAKFYSYLHPNTLLTKMNIANCLSDLGKKEDAMKLYLFVERDLENVLGNRHPHTLLTKMNRANLLSDEGRKEESLRIYSFVEEEQKKALGPNFPHTLITKMNIAVCLSHLGRREEALKFYSEVKEQQGKTLGNNHPHTLLTKKNIRACLLSGRGRKEESLTLYFVD